AAIARELQIPVVCPGPDYVGIFGRFTDGEDGLVLFRVRVINGHSTGLFLLQPCRIFSGQIRGDAVPGIALVGGPEKKLSAEIKSATGPDMNRRIPIEAKIR